VTDIRLATEGDMKYIESLANKEGFSIGFVPRQAYEGAITGVKAGKRWSDVCTDRLWVVEENGDDVGFLLASFGNEASVQQIAIQEDARLLTRGKALLSAFEDESLRRGIEVMRAGCANDLPSNAFWEAMGYRAWGVRKGIHFGTKKRSKRDVTVWKKTHSQLWLL